MWLPWRRKDKRAIFEFRDGAGTLRRVDPLVAWRKMVTDPELNVEDHFDMLRHADPLVALKASPIVAGAARRIFGLAEFSQDNPASVTDSEATQILLSYIEWWAGQKKSTSPSPTSQPAMA